MSAALTERDAALEFYTSAGAAVYPVDPTTKWPCIKKWNSAGAVRDTAQAIELFSAFPDAGIGIACKPSGYVVLDFDPRNGGEESWHTLVDEIGFEPFRSAPTVRTPSDGWHIYFRRPATFPARGQLGPGIDCITNLGVIAPPTKRLSGAYSWISPTEFIDELNPPIFPDVLIELLRASADVGRAQERRLTICAPGMIPEGQRNVTLTRYGGHLRRLGAGEDEIFTAIAAANKSRCVPPLPEEDLEMLAHSVARYAPATDSLLWLNAWLSKLSERQLKVAVALHGLAEFIVGPLTPATAVMCRKTGLDRSAYFGIRKGLEALGAIRVQSFGGRQRAAIIELCFPPDFSAKSIPIYIGVDSHGQAPALTRSA